MTVIWRDFRPRKLDALLVAVAAGAGSEVDLEEAEDFEAVALVDSEVQFALPSDQCVWV